MQQVGKEKIDMSEYKWVIDSGTSLIMGPQELISKLTAGITVDQKCGNIDQLPNVTFTIDETDYTLTPEDYVIKVTELGQTACLNGIMGGPLPADFKYVILGDVFMRKYLTYFDMNNNRVGFAQANH